MMPYQHVLSQHARSPIHARLHVALRLLSPAEGYRERRWLLAGAAELKASPLSDLVVTPRQLR